MFRRGNRLVDKDRQATPRMPPIQEFAETGTVGVIKPGCTMAAVRIRALTTAPRIKPTSIFLRSARRPTPGRGSTYRRGIVVQTTGTGSIHSKASLYQAFPAVEARRLVERFEWHYTPKHGSWLDPADSGTRRSVVQVPRPPDSRQTDPHRGNRRLGSRSQREPHQGQLALHYVLRPRKNQTPIPIILNESTD